MTNIPVEETYLETTVTYTIELEGKSYIIENVPARVCVETGERLFSPETVEILQQIILENETPLRLINTKSRLLTHPLSPKRSGMKNRTRRKSGKGIRERRQTVKPINRYVPLIRLKYECVNLTPSSTSSGLHIPFVEELEEV